MYYPEGKYEEMFKESLLLSELSWLLKSISITGLNESYWILHGSEISGEPSELSISNSRYRKHTYYISFLRDPLVIKRGNNKIFPEVTGPSQELSFIMSIRLLKESFAHSIHKKHNLLVTLDFLPAAT